MFFKRFFLGCFLHQRRSKKCEQGRFLRDFGRGCLVFVDFGWVRGFQVVI